MITSRIGSHYTLDKLLQISSESKNNRKRKMLYSKWRMMLHDQNTTVFNELLNGRYHI